jgi:hypothetical protein
MARAGWSRSPIGLARTDDVRLRPERQLGVRHGVPGQSSQNRDVYSFDRADQMVGVSWNRGSTVLGSASPMDPAT